MAASGLRKFSLAVLCLLAAMSRAKGQCDAVELVTREQWGARPPVHTTPLRLPVNMTFIHHSAGWDDIGYSFLVGNDGRVYEGRGWKTLPAHSPRYNYISHGICFLGNYMQVAPLPDALNAAQAWIQCGVEKKYIQPEYELFGHRDGRCTECPGDDLYAIIMTWPHYSTRHIPVVCGCLTLASSFVLTISCFLFSVNF